MSTIPHSIHRGTPTRVRYELVMFFDGCTDGSEAAARDVLHGFIGGTWPVCVSDDALADATDSCVRNAGVGPAHVRLVPFLL